MDYERISTYLHSLESDNIDLINDIETYALERNIPIAKRETVSFLQTMIKIKRPTRILEVGTAIAYSTLIMSLAAPDAEITTIEIGDVDYGLAVDNVKKAEDLGIIKKSSINLIHGDATDVLPSLDGTFDIIFMDAAKGQYAAWLPEVKRLMKNGSILISDNVLQDGTVLDSRYTVERRDRTIHKRMREYLYELKHTEGLSTSILPVGDGVALTVME